MGQAPCHTTLGQGLASLDCLSGRSSVCSGLGWWFWLWVKAASQCSTWNIHAWSAELGTKFKTQIFFNQKQEFVLEPLLCIIKNEVRVFKKKICSCERNCYHIFETSIGSCHLKYSKVLTERSKPFQMLFEGTGVCIFKCGNSGSIPMPVQDLAYHQYRALCRYRFYSRKYSRWFCFLFILSLSFCLSFSLYFS